MSPGGATGGGIPGWEAGPGGPGVGMPARRAPARASGPVLGRSVFRALVWQATRATLVQRRTILILILALAPAVVVVLLGSGAVGTPPTIARAVFAGISLPFVIPTIAVVLGTGVLGSEIEDGTLIHLLARPVGRGWIVLAKALVAASASAILASAGTLVASVLVLGVGSLGLTLAMVVGAAICGAVYAVVFVALSAWTSRALIVGLGYVMVWEAILTSLFPGARMLSIRVYAESVAAGLAGGDAGDLVAEVAMVPAVLLCLVVAAAALWLGRSRLRTHEVSQAG